MRRRWAGLVAGVAVLALGSGPGAWAEESGVPSPSPSPSVSPSVSGVPSPSVSGSPSPSADPSSPAPKGKAGIDATARMWPDLGSVWAGETFGIWAIAENLFETTPSLVLRLTLPEGVTYLGNMAGQTNGTCAPSGGRTLTCVADDGNTKQVMAKVRVKVADGLPPMTKLDFRAAADIGDAVDGNPANDVDDWTIRVMEPADVGVTWSMSPAGPVAAGTEVRTVFTVTNHGPGVSGSGTVKFYPGFDHWPTSMPSYPPCWVDPGVIICDRMGDLAPGETFSYSFTWKFPKKAAGTTYRVRGELYSASRHDPVSANDQAEAVFRIVKPKPKPTPKPTPNPKPSSGPTPSGSSSAPPAPAPSVAGGGGSLAATGSGGLGAAGWGAVGLVGVGGALFGAGWTRARRRALDER